MFVQGIGFEKMLLQVEYEFDTRKYLYANRDGFQVRKANHTGGNQLGKGSVDFFRIELALKYKNIVLCIKSKYGCIYKYLIKVSPQQGSSSLFLAETPHLERKMAASRWVNGSVGDSESLQEAEVTLLPVIDN